VILVRILSLVAALLAADPNGNFQPTSPYGDEAPISKPPREVVASSEGAAQ
jgi:hypothetical protein